MLFNSYEIDDIIYYIKNSRIAYEIAIKSGCSYLLDCINVLKKPSQKEKYFKSASLKIAQEIEKLRQKDRYYWRPIIRELKILNKTNQLLPVGTPVIHWMN